MPTPDCSHCLKAALIAQNLALCKLLKALLAILMEKQEAETRFLKRLMNDFERKG